MPTTSRFWDFNGLLDADFTHEGTRYDESDLTSFNLYSYILPEVSYYRPIYGSATNFLYLTFDNLYANLMTTALMEAHMITPTTVQVQQR